MITERIVTRMEIKKMQKLVNPSYNSAKGILRLLSAAGNLEAVKLAKKIDFSDVKFEDTTLQEITRCYQIGLETRYGIFTDVAMKSDKSNIVDLPCGYSPRGLFLVDTGKTYYGLDLPIVAADMQTAMSELMNNEYRTNIFYRGVDASNYVSIRQALSEAKGELCIITEGLLGYLNDSELACFCEGIHRLLSEFGGCWVTGDAISIDDIFPLIFSTLMNGNKETINSMMKQGGAKVADNNSHMTNSLYRLGKSGIRDYMEKQGFIISEEKVAGHLPKLNSVSAEEEKKLAVAYEELFFWKLSAGTSKVANSTDEQPFRITSEIYDETLHISLHGRLDTISAPELLQVFREEGIHAQNVKLDMSCVSFVSSAGNRVLRMIREEVKDKGRLEIIEGKKCVGLDYNSLEIVKK